MGRVMALDLGDKRIGIAMSDPLRITAQGLETYVKKDLDADIDYIISLTVKYNTEAIVVGLPLNMNGSEGPAVEKVRAFCGELGGKTDIPIVFQDERLTTAGAQRVLLEADVSRAKRKKVIDKMAAVMILQSYLESKKLF